MVYKKDLETHRKWAALMSQLKLIVGQRPKDLNSVLYLIGIQELGRGVVEFTKEEKQDLMHIAVCKVLSLSGFYELEGRDEEGWPHWKPTEKLPNLKLQEQEVLLKRSILEYFETELMLDLSSNS